jgi:hypothetical protein
MVKIETIESEYARMPDGALLALASELSTLTPEARLALEAECIRRDLLGMMPVSFPVEMPAGREQEIAQKLNNEKDKKAREKWDYALGRKWENIADETVHFGLQVRGLKPDEASFVMQGLEEKAVSRLKEVESERFGAFIRAICGAAVIIIGLLTNYTRTLFFIGSMVMIISIVQAAIASNRKARYETALENMKPIVYDEIKTGDEEG